MKKNTGKKQVASGASMEGGAKGLVAAGAVAAAVGGAYLFLQSMTKKTDRKPQSWILRAKADVMEEVQKVPHISQKAYRGIIDSVLKHYGKMKDVSRSELSALKKDLEKNWKDTVEALKSN